MTLPDGRYFDYKWDDAHRLTDITDRAGNNTRYTLDTAGNVTRVDVVDAGDALARQQRTDYDPLGRPWKHYNAAGDVTERQHDAMNRLNKIIDPKNRETDYSWDALGRLSQIDDAQQPTRGITQAQYNGQDQLTALTVRPTEPTPNSRSMGSATRHRKSARIVARWPTPWTQPATSRGARMGWRVSPTTRGMR
jgi:YD repeat-containing protein